MYNPFEIFFLSQKHALFPSTIHIFAFPQRQVQASYSCNIFALGSTTKYCSNKRKVHWKPRQKKKILKFANPLIISNEKNIDCENSSWLAGTKRSLRTWRESSARVSVAPSRPRCTTSSTSDGIGRPRLCARQSRRRSHSFFCCHWTSLWYCSPCYSFLCWLFIESLRGALDERRYSHRRGLYRILN